MFSFFNLTLQAHEVLSPKTRKDLANFMCHSTSVSERYYKVRQKSTRNVKASKVLRGLLLARKVLVLPRQMHQQKFFSPVNQAGLFLKSAGRDRSCHLAHAVEFARSLLAPES